MVHSHVAHGTQAQKTLLKGQQWLTLAGGIMGDTHKTLYICFRSPHAYFCNRKVILFFKCAYTLNW